MARKLTYKEVKNYIEIESNSGCKLLSEEYINSNEKLKLKCKCGNTFLVSLNTFTTSKQIQCKSCNNYTNWDINSVEKFLNQLGFKLISNTYVNNLIKLKFKDSDGYVYKNSLISIQNNKPSRFSVYNPYTIENIKLWCKLNNKPFKLISDKYENSKKRLKWKCLKESCGEIFEATWSGIRNGNSCAVCAGQQVGLSNCLATKNPEIAKEWHPTKNGNLTPYDVTEFSSKKVWWMCNRGHEWKDSVSHRSIYLVCPYCNHQRPSKEYNLLVVNPELCEEWDYSKNKKKPEEYLPNSNKKVWWKCKECGYGWEAKILNRNASNSMCPQCNQSKGERKIDDYLVQKGFISISQENFDQLTNYEKLNNLYYIPQKEFDGLLGVGKGNLSYDFYLPNYNLLIEYQGEFHDCNNNKGTRYMKERFPIQQEHDKRKKDYAQNSNIKLLEIWYWDFDNVEEILNQEIKEIEYVIK